MTSQTIPVERLQSRIYKTIASFQASEEKAQICRHLAEKLVSFHNAWKGSMGYFQSSVRYIGLQNY